MEAFNIDRFRECFKDSNNQASLFRKFYFMGCIIYIYFGDYGKGLDFDVKKDSLFIFGRRIGGLGKNDNFDYLIKLITFNLIRTILRTENASDKLILEKLLCELKGDENK